MGIFVHLDSSVVIKPTATGVLSWLGLSRLLITLLCKAMFYVESAREKIAKFKREKMSFNLVHFCTTIVRLERVAGQTNFV